MWGNAKKGGGFVRSAATMDRPDPAPGRQTKAICGWPQVFTMAW